MGSEACSGSSVDERGKTHHGKSNLFQETPKTFLPTDIKHCLNVGYTFVNFTTSEAVWKSHVCITRKSWPLFKSKKIAQVVRAWIQSKNSLVKHFEDMRLCRPSKEYLLVWFDPPRDESMSCLTTKGMHTIGAVCARSPKPIRNHFNRPITHAISSTDILNLQALISLTDDLSLLSNMAALESCPKHNMIAYLEKTEGNVEFHEVIDFLQRSYISHALTVSPVVSTTFVEQFWTSAKSKTINNVKHITAKVAGKLVSISEASIRTDLLFDDADGTDTLPNQAIFDAIQLMGYEGDLTKGKHFSGKVTPLFDTMLVQPTQDEGASSERLSDEQPSPSPAPTSEVPNESLPDSSSAQPSEVPIEHQPVPSPRPSPTATIPDSIPEPTGENLGDHSSNDTSLSGNEDDMTLQNVYDLCLSLCKQVSDQAKEIKLLKAKITKLKKQAKPVIKHHKAYLKTVSLQQRFPRKSFSKKHRMHKESNKRSDVQISFAIGLLKDERLIKRMKKKNKKDSSKGKSINEKRHKKEKARNDELRLCLTIAPDEDKEVDYEILDGRSIHHLTWKTEKLGTNP
ncbi:putative ribonuclease H-like domain-containing protein [Tanacetum coccineum]